MKNIKVSAAGPIFIATFGRTFFTRKLVIVFSAALFTSEVGIMNKSFLKTLITVAQPDKAKENTILKKYRIL